MYSGSTVNFSCEDNYILNDTNIITTSCKQNGKWDGYIPHCVKSEIIFADYRVATICLTGNF